MPNAFLEEYTVEPERAFFGVGHRFPGFGVVFLTSDVLIFGGSTGGSS